MASPTLADASRMRPVKKWINAKSGMRVVPGHGDGTKDTVNAKLAPHEAVLNKAAAEKLGRGKIAKLNADGVKKMGFRSAYKKKKGFATGTKDVESEASVKKNEAVPKSSPEPKDPDVREDRADPSGASPAAIKRYMKARDEDRPAEIDSEEAMQYLKWVKQQHKNNPDEYAKGTSDVKRGLRSVYKSRKD